VLAEHGIEMFDLRLQSGSRETEENDASMSQFLLEDQLAEVAVGNDQNSLLFLGYPRDCLNVVSETIRP
jgi:hypothetical protein